ncbi:MAG TPA: type I 3-dehydroquinate dehydratase [Candidatus Acidoferrum sp.]|nr:type I 3-dehydroquinate dehydratase [Candidatus Acidoferrum sp.]
MPPLHIAFRHGNRVLTVGRAPIVVGTLSSLPRQFPPPRQKIDCDVVEVRLDKSGCPSDWLARCQRIESQGWPVLLTIRLKSEGGHWDDGDARRLPLFAQALDQLSGVDVEWRSSIVHRVAILAKRLRKICVISYHDFKKTPPPADLAAIILKAQKLASIVKIATRVNNQDDDQNLRLLLAQKWKRPLCLIGLGPAGAHTRVLYPQLGSCLTYGYLDKPAAPGQLPAADLTRQLRQQKPPLNSQLSKPPGGQR